LQFTQGKWVTQAPARFPLRRFRMISGGLVHEHVALQFNQAQDELQSATAGARDIAGTVRTIYIAYPFTNGQAVRIPHLLGTPNVSMLMSAPRSLSAGSPWATWAIDTTDSTVVIATPSGTFSADIEFRILSTGGSP